MQLVSTVINKVEAKTPEELVNIINSIDFEVMLNEIEKIEGWEKNKPSKDYSISTNNAIIKSAEKERFNYEE